MGDVNGSPLPEPKDDDGADHLPDAPVPALSLPATDGTSVDLSPFDESGVVYCYPRTGRPDRDVSPDYWEEIPGARGCTPESCGFRDRHRELSELGFSDEFALSVQSTEYQREARDLLGLSFELLSDSSVEFADSLELPRFEVEGVTLLKRLSLVISDGRIRHVFYPVFPPDEYASEVVEWAETHLPD